MYPAAGSLHAGALHATRRLQRAIGVIYRPQTERQSHCFHVDLPRASSTRRRPFLRAPEPGLADCSGIRRNELRGTPVHTAPVRFHSRGFETNAERTMLPSPFYDEVPQDIGGNEVWARAHASGHEEAGNAARALLERLLSLLSLLRAGGARVTAGWGRPATLRQPCR
jgi:hypothetical protein